ncbi:MAG: NAD(+) synthase, partial [Planctomycetia bacterium]
PLTPTDPEETAAAERLVVGVDICEDRWAPTPPSVDQALAGATVLLNLSASVESTGKAEYRRDLVAVHSARLQAAYVYAAAGVGESTTDVVFGGHSLVAEGGLTLVESPRFRRTADLWTADVDVEKLTGDRWRQSTFADAAPSKVFRRVPFTLPAWSAVDVRRFIPAHPFIPVGADKLAARCGEIFSTQTAGLAKRLETANTKALHIGVSGGLDSTLALLVACKTCDLLGWERSRVHGLTMPGFGTSSRTFGNATALMDALGVRGERIDVRPLCLDAFRSLKHSPFGIDVSTMDVEPLQRELTKIPADRRHDLVFENVQARMRTLLLMNRGFVLGTGDLSELALGWCTYNADHMSMYNPNASVPKTLVRFLVRWAADAEFAGSARAVLHSIADTEISPELLPLGEGEALQSTEATVGPYELHDFFLYHVLRLGFGPRKILHLALRATFDRRYDVGEIHRWLTVFVRRFFSQQFKRSCLPDGPKIGSVSLSPRGDWRMPSDADPAAWLAELSVAAAELDLNGGPA